jgi:hypothetical protein
VSHEPIENVTDKREREKDEDSPERRGTGIGNMSQTQKDTGHSEACVCQGDKVRQDKGSDHGYRFIGWVLHTLIDSFLKDRILSSDPFCV